MVGSPSAGPAQSDRRGLRSPGLQAFAQSARRSRQVSAADAFSRSRFHRGFSATPTASQRWSAFLARSSKTVRFGTQLAWKSSTHSRADAGRRLAMQHRKGGIHHDCPDQRSTLDGKPSAASLRLAGFWASLSWPLDHDPGLIRAAWQSREARHHLWRVPDHELWRRLPVHPAGLLSKKKDSSNAAGHGSESRSRALSAVTSTPAASPGRHSCLRRTAASRSFR